MSESHYALGLDIGIGSVGWAVLQNNLNGEPIRIWDLGVRSFDKAEQPKTGESLAAPRRDAEVPGDVCVVIVIGWNGSNICSSKQTS